MPANGPTAQPSQHSLGRCHPQHRIATVAAGRRIGLTGEGPGEGGGSLSPSPTDRCDAGWTCKRGTIVLLSPELGMLCVWRSVAVAVLGRPRAHSRRSKFGESDATVSNAHFAHVAPDINPHWQLVTGAWPSVKGNRPAVPKRILVCSTICRQTTYFSIAIALLFGSKQGEQSRGNHQEVTRKKQDTWPFCNDNKRHAKPTQPEASDCLPWSRVPDRETKTGPRQMTRRHCEGNHTALSPPLGREPGAPV